MVEWEQVLRKERLVTSSRVPNQECFFRRALPVLLALLLVESGAPAQPPVRRATTIEALRLYPGFYHLQPVIVRGELTGHDDHELLRSDEQEVRLVMHTAAPTAGQVEVRGELLDIGRLQRDDPRLQTLGIGDAIQTLYKDRWPTPGEALMLNVTTIEPATPPPAPTIRAIALDPGRYTQDRVTVTGQFRGRNLYGDLPDAPGTSGNDFVLRSGGAAIWVTNLRPKGKGFDLNVNARVDTGHWVEVSGTVRRARGLVWLEGEQIALAKEPPRVLAAEPAAIVPIPVPVAPPIEVVFSSPIQNDTDISPTSDIRLQFSRNIDPGSLQGRVRVSYVAAAGASQADAATLPVTFSYDASAHAVTIKPAAVLERLRRVKVELLDGIAGVDGGAVKPFTLVFSVSG